MIADKTFQKGTLKAEVLAPGLFRIQDRGKSGNGVLTVNANTDQVLWQEDSDEQGLPSVTIGVTRPFHLFRTGGLLKAAESGEYDPDRIQTVEARAADLFLKGREFLKQYHVSLAPDSRTRERFRNFLDGLEIRERVDSSTLRPGSTVALFLGSEKKRVYLLKILDIKPAAEGMKYFICEGVMAERKEDGDFRLTYQPGSSSQGWPVDPNLDLVAIHPDELRQFYTPDSRVDTESTAYFEKRSAWNQRADIPWSSHLVTVQSLGGVAI